MGLTARQVTRGALALLALLALLAAIDGFGWWRAVRFNRMIESGNIPAGADALPPQVRFAQARAQALHGEAEAALRGYRSLQTDPVVGLAARYNSANLLMRQATALQGGPKAGEAIALIELAKESYADVLRAEPDRWDARYNLERAERLLPDPEPMEIEPLVPQPDAERAATTMRGYSPGLP